MNGLILFSIVILLTGATTPPKKLDTSKVNRSPPKDAVATQEPTGPNKNIYLELNKVFQKSIQTSKQKSKR